MGYKSKSSTLGLMKNQLTKWLKLVCQNAWQEFLRRPIATIGVLIGIGGLLLPILLSESLREKIWRLLLTTKQLTIEMNIILVVLAFLLLLYSSYHLLKKLKKQREKDKTLFISYGGFYWKISIFESGKIFVDPAPYCKKHQVKMASTHLGLICAVCGSESAIEEDRSYLEKTRELVENLVTAHQEGHLVINSNHNS